MYKQIRRYLEELIAEHQNTPDYKLPSENQLAALFHTSRIPVQCALDELEADGIIWRKKGKGSFIAGTNATDSKQLRVCLLIPAMDSKLYGAIFRGVSEVLTAEGVYLYNVITKDNVAFEEACINDCLKQNFDGMIVFPAVAQTYSDTFLQLVLRHYPVVLVGRSFPGLNISYVAGNHYEQCYRATEELIRQGHEHIAYFGEDGDSAAPYQERVQAYRTCILEHFSSDHLNLQTVNFFDQTLRQSKQLGNVLEQAVGALFEKPVTAVITSNHGIAPLLNHMKEPSYSHVRLMLFDYPTGYAVSGQLPRHDPMVTCQNFHEMGRVAARQLLRQIREQAAPAQIQLNPLFFQTINDLDRHIYKNTSASIRQTATEKK